MPPYRPFEERFWSRVSKSDSCWVWTGRVNEKGYGVISTRERKAKYVHRASWELHNGPLPAGACVCHRCDNPPCVNPAHLFLGTLAENNADALAKGRVARGERAGRSKLTEAAALEICRARDAGESQSSIARRYGIDQSAVSHLVRGKNWKHLKRAS